MALLSGPAIGACQSVSTGINTRMVAVQQEIVRALRRDDLGTARRLAVELEREQPAADTYALLGEVLWRTGELVDAEGLFRRAAAGGAPGGSIGLGRAHLAQGNFDGVREKLEPLTSIEGSARAAHSLLATVAWLECRCADAATELAAASAALQEGGQWPGVEALALQSASPADLAALLTWKGDVSKLAIDAEGRVEVVVEGTPLRLSLALDGRRTTIGGPAAVELAPDVPRPAVSALVAGVRLGELQTTAVVRIDPTLPADGVLGLDLLADLHWQLSLGERTLRLATTAEAATQLAPTDLRNIYWGTARVPRDGLGVQLLLRPRVGGQVLSAVVDVVGVSRLSEFVVRDLFAEQATSGVTSQLELELRIGSRRRMVAWEVADLLPMGHGGLVAPRAVIGADVLSQLRLRWRPDRMQVSYEDLSVGTATLAGR